MTARPPLPAVRRDVVRAHCLDAEDSRGSDMSDTIELAQTRCMMLADKGEPKAALPHCQEDE